MVGVAFVSVYFVFAYNASTNFILCTAEVTQPICYTATAPTPTLNWTVTGTSIQTAYWIQVDDNSDFSSPIIDTGEVVSTDLFYTISESMGLAFETTYYWRIRIRDNFNSIIDSWVEADEPFTTVANCTLGADNMSVTRGDYCSTPSHYFLWRYMDPGDRAEKWFQFQADDNNDFSSPEIDREYNVSFPNLSYNNQMVLVVDAPLVDQFGYDITYYWRVKVRNDLGDESGWNEGPALKTEKHRYPSVDATWFPTTPDMDEDVQFTDLTIVYGGTTKIAWSWMFEDGNPASFVEQNPVVQFNSRGNKQITLTVTDSDGYSCPFDGGFTTIIIKKDVPDWREILPW